MATAFLGPPTDPRTLQEFYRKVRPFGPGWRRIREAAGVAEPPPAETRENIPLALLGWTAGCAAIWSSLFAVGSLLYGRWVHAGCLLATFALSGCALLWVVRRLWSRPDAAGPS
jgi:hypothetical protein